MQKDEITLQKIRLPAIILTPKKAHRIPRTAAWEEAIDNLRVYNINATTFLLDAAQIEAASKDGWTNDEEAARQDFINQITPHIISFLIPSKE